MANARSRAMGKSTNFDELNNQMFTVINEECLTKYAVHSGKS